MADWKVYPHQPLQKLTANLWCVEGSSGSVPLPRRMCVIKLADGGLVIHSAVCLNQTSMAELEAWGEPAYLVVPNVFHRMDAARYAARYPRIKVLCPSEAAGKVGQVVRVDGALEDLPNDGSVRVESLDGMKVQEAAFIVTSGTQRSLVLTDAVFNVPHLKGFSGKVLRLLGSTGGPRVTPIAKFGMVKNKAALAEHLRRLAGLEGLARLVPAHGNIIETNAADVLRGVADRLAP
jgi:hypothetical protein